MEFGWPDSRKPESAGRSKHSVVDLKNGICFRARYVGCIGVIKSMKSINFQLRSLIAKESIIRVCDTGNLINSKKRKVNKRISAFLGEGPIMTNAGENVNFIVSTAGFCIKCMENDVTIVQHSMPAISFASAGDDDTSEFIAYVAKDENEFRACHVLELENSGLAQEVISTVGEAFAVRYKEQKSQNQFCLPQTSPPAPMDSVQSRTANAKPMPKKRNVLPFNNGPSGGPDSTDPNARTYYNDFPPRLPATQPDAGHLASTSTSRASGAPLIDLNDFNGNDLVSAANGGGEELGESTALTKIKGPHYENEEIMAQLQERQISFQPPLTEVGRKNHHLLMCQVYYHGALSREEAEALILDEGSFLVRQSGQSRDQFVLSGMQDGKIHHLLLVDDDGDRAVIRTSDRTFSDIPHLINYHRENNLPIASPESALILRTPIAYK